MSAVRLHGCLPKVERKPHHVPLQTDESQNPGRCLLGLEQSLVPQQRPRIRQVLFKCRGFRWKSHSQGH